MRPSEVVHALTMLRPLVQDALTDNLAALHAVNASQHVHLRGLPAGGEA